MVGVELDKSFDEDGWRDMTTQPWNKRYVELFCTTHCLPIGSMLWLNLSRRQVAGCIKCKPWVSEQKVFRFLLPLYPRVKGQYPGPSTIGPNGGMGRTHGDFAVWLEIGALPLAVLECDGEQRK